MKVTATCVGNPQDVTSVSHHSSWDGDGAPCESPMVLSVTTHPYSCK